MTHSNLSEVNREHGDIRRLELQVRFAAALMIIASVTFITIYFCTDLAIQAPTASPVTGIALMIALIVWAKNRTAALARAKTR